MPKTLGAPTTSAVQNFLLTADFPALTDGRLVVSPAKGRFVPLPPEIFTTEGEWVEVGTALAEVVSGDARTEVRSAFRGWMMGSLALPGEPVKPGDALFCIKEC